MAGKTAKKPSMRAAVAAEAKPTPPVAPGEPGRRKRADAQRNLDSLLEAALAVFAASGVDAPVRAIADKAGVGIATIYRNFPQRADLIVAVMRHEIDACAAAKDTLAAAHAPGEALARWVQRFVDFLGAKRGMAAALHSGDPAYAPLPDYFRQKLEPAMRTLLDAAIAAGDVRPGVDANELLLAIARLASPAPDGNGGEGRRMVALLLDGLRYGATKTAGKKRSGS